MLEEEAKTRPLELVEEWDEPIHNLPELLTPLRVASLTHDCVSATPRIEDEFVAFVFLYMPCVDNNTIAKKHPRSPFADKHSHALARQFRKSPHIPSQLRLCMGGTQRSTSQPDIGSHLNACPQRRRGLRCV